jgi:DNA-binding transcriptional MerR regulator
MSEMVSTGEEARQLGVSMSLLRKLEATGVTPPAQRIAGLDRRIYTPLDVEVLRKIIAGRRAGIAQARA